MQCYNRDVGQGMLTGQAPPLAERFSLRADLAAWYAAVRGLRDNPLLTHLRLAKQRRQARIPRWRRYMPLLLALLFCLLTTPLMISGTASTYGGNYLPIFLRLIASQLVLAWFACWFVQGLFEAVLRAAGVLGRWSKRSSPLVLDDFAALTNLEEHEITAAMVAALLPPLAWRCIAGILLLHDTSA